MKTQDSEISRISYKALADNPEQVLDQVVSDQTAVVVETRDGQFALLSYLAPGTVVTNQTLNIAAFRAAAGSWSSTEAEELLAKVKKSRRQKGRPPVRL
jgi:hypothetical protein